MNKTVKKVFMLLALLVGIFLAWQLIFNDGGILQTVYNSMVRGINTQYEKVAGQGQQLLPEWGNGNSGQQRGTNGDAFDINDTP